MEPAKTPLIIDVDTGTDDAICIAAALQRQDQLDILGFTTVCGNVGVDRASRNTLDLVDFLGSDRPVLVGAAKPLVQDLHLAVSHGTTGLGDVILEPARAKFSPEAPATFIRDAAVANAGTLEILATGPLTNIALAIQQYPELRELIRRITIMGGGICGGNMTIASEFNMYNDPDAGRVVFESGIDLTMVGLDVTLQPKLPQFVVDAVRAGTGRPADVVGRILDFMQRRKVDIGGDDPNLHDVIALTAIVEPGILTLTDYYVYVETGGEITRGMTIADFHNVAERQPNAHVATAIDIDRFWTWFTSTILKAE